MELSIPLSGGLRLHLSDQPAADRQYPTSRLQKAFLLSHGGRSLAQEAVGFGFPLIKRGLMTIFPGSVELSSQQRGADWEVIAVYTLNMKEKIFRPGNKRIHHELLYTVKNFMALIIRRFPVLRGVLTGASNVLRRGLGWETAYEDAGFRIKVKVRYTLSVEMETMRVEADWTELIDSGITEMVIMNEQGANYFDWYRDSSGKFLQGKEIGCWDEVFADEACFISTESRVGFSLGRIPGARLFRGRELVGSRLAWAGFGYSIDPHADNFSYTIKIGKYS